MRGTRLRKRNLIRCMIIGPSMSINTCSPSRRLVLICLYTHLSTRPNDLFTLQLEVNSVSIPRGIDSFNINHMTMRAVPKKCLLAFHDLEILSSTPNIQPTMFKPYNLKKYTLRFGSTILDSHTFTDDPLSYTPILKRLPITFSSSLDERDRLHLANSLSIQTYRTNKFLIPIDFERNWPSLVGMNSSQLSIDIHFSKPLDKSIVLLCYNSFSAGILFNRDNTCLLMRVD